jgi:hypothetical protein
MQVGFVPYLPVVEIERIDQKLASIHVTLFRRTLFCLSSFAVAFFPVSSLLLFFYWLLSGNDSSRVCIKMDY